MSHQFISFSLFFLLLFNLLLSLPAQAAKTFKDTSFAVTWNWVDKPVQELPGIGRGYTWGPPVQGSEAITGEAYENGARKVQYFDKARMELNNPNGNPVDLFYVTTGLLVKELVTGYRQDGDNKFTVLAPSQVQVAGDPNTGNANAIAPTYASFGAVITTQGTDKAKPNLVGSLVSSRINRSGEVSDFTPSVPVRLTAFDSLTYHNIADVFEDYGNQLGTIWNGTSFAQGPVFFGNAVYVLGRPVTDPLWTRAVVAGVEKDVLVQLFERRVLTYTPDNPTGFKVEMGNLGQHYYRWRYQLNQPYPDAPTNLTRLGEFGQDTNGLRYPSKIAVDSRENIYLSDYSNRIVRYDLSGKVKARFGGSGSEDGHFVSLGDMAVDKQDKLFAVDTNGNQVQKFDADGVLLLKWGSKGSGNGQFIQPQSVTVDDQNNIYILDLTRVQKFDSAGDFLSGWTTPAIGGGKLLNPVHLVLDKDKNVYVLDIVTNGRLPNFFVNKYDPSGRFLLSWSIGVPGSISALSADGQGNLLYGLFRYDGNGKVIGQLADRFTNPVDGTPPTPGATTANSQGQIYFTDLHHPWIYKVDRDGNLLAYFSTYGRDPGFVKYPGSAAVDGANNLYIFDTLNYRVQKFDSDGNFLLTWGSRGSGDGQFAGEGSLAVDPAGNVYVADAPNHRVQKFDAQGHFLLKWGKVPANNADCEGTLAFPNSIEVASDGSVFVLDGQVKCIQKFDAQGHFLQLWGGLGINDGSLLSPNALATDGQGNLFFAQEENHRIFKVDLFFKSILTWGEYGATPGQFDRPSAIALDSHNNLYVIDQGKNHLQKFDANGKLLATATLSNDQSVHISGLAVDARGLIYLSDSSNDHILKYAQS